MVAKEAAERGGQVHTSLQMAIRLQCACLTTQLLSCQIIARFLIESVDPNPYIILQTVIT